MSTRFPSTHSSLRVGLQCSQGWQRGNKRPLAVGFGWLCTLKTNKSVSRHVTKNIVRERSLPQRDSGDCSRNVCPSTARGKSKLIFAVWACPQIAAAITERDNVVFLAHSLMLYMYLNTSLGDSILWNISTCTTCRTYRSSALSIRRCHPQKNNYRFSGCGGQIFDLIKAVIFVICCGFNFLNLLKP